MRSIKLVLYILGFGLLLAGNASAHALLKKAEPAVGSTVAIGPIELRLHFTEAVELKFSGVKVSLEGGKALLAAKTAVDSVDPQTLVVTLTDPLAPGVYRVQWKVVSVDTHKTQGDYRFTVKP